MVGRSWSSEWDFVKALMSLRDAQDDRLCLHNVQSTNTECTLKDTTFTELRNHARHYFDLVEAGQVVRVLRNGKPIAEIHPIPRDLPSWKKRAASPLKIGGKAISKLIVEDRTR